MRPPNARAEPDPEQKLVASHRMTGADPLLPFKFVPKDGRNALNSGHSPAAAGTDHLSTLSSKGDTLPLVRPFPRTHPRDEFWAHFGGEPA